MIDKSITVVGMGYIGLPTATILAARGYTVFGYDINEHIIAELSSGNTHFFEPELQGLFKSVLDSGNLIPSSSLTQSDIFIICVPTPFKSVAGMRKADLSRVASAAREVARVLQEGNLVVLESTVPPGTTEGLMTETIEQESHLKVNADFFVAHCPERVLPGRIIHELRNNDRIIGVSSDRAGELARELYSSIVSGASIYLTDTITAEMCKLAENAFRDVSIAFANELSMICDELNINVFELINLANKHPRVSILSPGAGVGGHCIAVDPWFIVEKLPETARLIKTARETNDNKPLWIVKKVLEDAERMFGSRRLTFGILGLAYKANVGDFRESPALLIAKELKRLGHNVIACEPNSESPQLKTIPNLRLETVVNEADYLIYAVAHSQFREGYVEMIKQKPIYDAVGEL